MFESGETLSTAELEAFYKTNKNNVWKYLVSLTRNEEEADDLTQAVFLKFIDQVDRGLVRRDQARSMLFRMAYNLFIDQFRRGRRELELLEEQAARSVEAGPARSRHGDILDTIARAIESGTLSERRRTVLQLRLLGQMSVKEIAETLAVSKSTVYSEIEDSLDFLRDALEAAGLNPDELS